MNYINNKYYIIIRDTLIVCLIILSISITKNEIKEEIKEVNKTIKVDLKGAVVNTGVYELNTGSNINDLLQLAGGVKENAYTNNINLSKKLKDEMVIYVYTKNEIKKYKEENKVDVVKNIEKEECICPKEIISNCEGSSIIEVNDTPNIETEDKEIVSETNNRININTSSKAELMTISGIGESKALSIIDYREKNGPYKNIEDIKNVSGIGDSLFAKIKDYITV